MRYLSSMFLSLCLVSPLVVAKEAGVFDSVVVAFIQVTKNILTGEKELFAQLAKTQASSVLGDIYTQAGTLQTDKRQLRKDIESQKITCNEAWPRVDALQQQVRSLSDELHRFGHEINNVSGLTAGPLQVAADKLTSSKVDELRKAASLCAENREAALKAIDAAMKDTEKIQDAAKCLKDTIDKKQASCDPDTLKPKASS